MNIFTRAGLQLRDAFNSIFGSKQNTNYYNYADYQSLIGYSNPLSRYSGDVLDNALIKRTIDCIATHASQLKVQHIIQDKGKTEIVNDNIEYLCNFKPNELMNANDFWYRVISCLFINNNAFIYPKFDARGELIALYPIDFYSLTWKEDTKGNVCCEFVFSKQKIVLPYSMLIHLRRQYIQNSMSGDNQDEQLLQMLNNSKLLSDARKNILKANGTPNFVLQANVSVKKDDLDKAVKDFVNSYGYANRVASVDNRFQITPVSSQTTNVSQDEIDSAEKEILQYFGVSKALISGDYTPEQMMAFQESVIAPIANQIGQALTTGLLSKIKINLGHQIRVNNNVLQYASVSSKIDLVSKLVTNGVISINDARALLGLDNRQEEEADWLRTSLNTVNLEDAGDYQLGKAGVEVNTDNRIKSNNKTDKENIKEKEEEKNE